MEAAEQSSGPNIFQMAEVEATQNVSTALTIVTLLYFCMHDRRTHRLQGTWSLTDAAPYVIDYVKKLV